MRVFYIFIPTTKQYLFILLISKQIIMLIKPNSVFFIGAVDMNQ